MSLARAFTGRRFKSQDDGTLGRGNINKCSPGSIRNRISGPVELISTTNMLSYTAPDIFPLSESTTSSSPKSDDDVFDTTPVSAWTPPTSPESESPKRASWRKAGKASHLSSYFLPSGAAPGKADTLSVAKRVSSQVKKAAHESLSRARSASHLSQQSQGTLSGKGSLTFSRPSSASTNTSSSSGLAMPPHPSSSAAAPTAHPYPVHLQHRKDYSLGQHPFGMELAQVTEIAEEYGLEDELLVVDVEEMELHAKGLVKISADDYLSEVQSLFVSFFGDAKPPAHALWI